MRKDIITMIAISVSLFLGVLIGTKINTNDSLNLNTVVDFEATEDGLMLYTQDGSGYYLEK